MYFFNMHPRNSLFQLTGYQRGLKISPFPFFCGLKYRRRGEMPSERATMRKILTSTPTSAPLCLMKKGSPPPLIQTHTIYITCVNSKKTRPLPTFRGRKRRALSDGRNRFLCCTTSFAGLFMLCGQKRKKNVSAYEENFVILRAERLNK